MRLIGGFIFFFLLLHLFTEKGSFLSRTMNPSLKCRINIFNNWSFFLKLKKALFCKNLCINRCGSLKHHYTLKTLVEHSFCRSHSQFSSHGYHEGLSFAALSSEWDEPLEQAKGNHGIWKRQAVTSTIALTLVSLDVFQ